LEVNVKCGYVGCSGIVPMGVNDLYTITNIYVWN